MDNEMINARSFATQETSAMDKAVKAKDIILYNPF